MQMLRDVILDEGMLRLLNVLGSTLGLLGAVLWIAAREGTSPR
jgi:uncharacterized protein involved in response to NO